MCIIVLFVDETVTEIATEEGRTVGLRPRTANEGAPARGVVTGHPKLPRGSAVAAENGSLREIVVVTAIGTVIERGKQRALLCLHADNLFAFA